VGFYRFIKVADHFGFAVRRRRRSKCALDAVVKIMDARVFQTKDWRGAFKGEVPEAPVKIVSARRESTAARRADGPTLYGSVCT